jgi:hypothetical protein
VVGEQSVAGDVALGGEITDELVDLFMHCCTYNR